MIRNNLAMRASFAIVLVSLAAVAVCELADAQRVGSKLSAQQVVKGLDLTKYSGRWYEIAKYPSVFEPRNAENTRATYSLRADGKLDVLNEAFVKGRKISIKGYAYKANPKSDEAKFKVKFDSVPFITGDYWVLYVDADYQFAVVGHPFRTNLYILSRTNKIDDQVYNQLVQKAVDQGYNAQKLVKTPQTDPSPT